MLTPWKKRSEKEEKVGWRTILHRVFAHSNGKEVECTIVDTMTGSAVFALTPDRKVILCRHFRPGPGKILYQLPAGLIEAGETPFDAARRELREETGYEGTLEYVGMHHAWSWGKGIAHVFLARDCHRMTEPRSDGFEVIETKLVSLQTFEGLLQAGQVIEPSNGYLGLGFLHWQDRVRAAGNVPRRVAVCLLRHEGKFLLQHRTDDAPRDPGRWGLFGGHMDDDDTPPDAVKTPLETIKREMKEELDYDLADPELIFVYRDEEVEVSVFMEIYDPTKKLTLLEGQNMKWFTFEEVEKLDMVGADRQAFVDRLREVWEEEKGI